MPKTYTEESYTGKRLEMTAPELVDLYGSDRWGSSGQIETVKSGLDNTRAILGRLIEALSDKGLLTDDEVLKVIRG